MTKKKPTMKTSPPSAPNKHPAYEDLVLYHLPWGHQIVDAALNTVLLALPDANPNDKTSPQYTAAQQRYYAIVAMYQKLTDNNLDTRQMRSALASVINTGRLLGTPRMQQHLFELGLVNRQPDGNGNYQPIYPTTEQEPE
jgi:hypothetical protein